MRQQHALDFGAASESDTHQTGFGEVSLTGTRGAHTWVIGAAMQAESYRNRTVPGYDYTYAAPGLFAQDEVALTGTVRASFSARVDRHSRFGTFASPRVAVQWRRDDWTLRGSAGTGYFAPTPLTEETEAVGLTRLAFADLERAEAARSYSADLARPLGPSQLNAAVFGSRVNDTLDVRPSATVTGSYELVPLAGPTLTYGAELLATVRRGDIGVVGSYTFVHATEPDVLTGQRLQAALVPTHTAGLVVTWEREGQARVGVETYFTGRQRLDDGPYRPASEPYVYFGAMAERIIGRVRLFVNVENLSDRRQTRFDPLVRPSPRFDGRWTVDVWGPVEGRVLNTGLRLRF
jgi:iron complex outermembrane receptor protein